MTDLNQVLQLEDDRWAALTSADVPRLEAIFDDEMFYTHSNGMVDAKSTYLDALGSGRYRYSTVQTRDVEARAFGSTVAVTGRATIVSALADREVRVESRYSAIWSRGTGGWRLVCWHSCPVAEAA